jgi:hypothetical protein
MKIKEDIKLDFSDVLIEPLASNKTLTRKGVDIEIDWLGSIKQHLFVFLICLVHGTVLPSAITTGTCTEWHTAVVPAGTLPANLTKADDGASMGNPRGLSQGCLRLQNLKKNAKDHDPKAVHRCATRGDCPRDAFASRTLKNCQRPRPQGRGCHSPCPRALESSPRCGSTSTGPCEWNDGQL